MVDVKASSPRGRWRRLVTVAQLGVVADPLNTTAADHGAHLATRDARASTATAVRLRALAEPPVIVI